MENVKGEKKIQIMHAGGQKLGAILQELIDKIAPGITPKELDMHAKKRIYQEGGSPSFTTVRSYKWATCINVNDGVVHGIPGNVPFQKGDVVTIDIGMIYKGFHTDTAFTKAVGDVDKNMHEFLQAGEIALQKAIKAAKMGNRVGHISKSIQETIEGKGYSVVPSLVGHGVGKKLHESPQVPGVLKKAIEKTTRLIEGMTLAIEVIYTMGKPDTIYHSDGWTIKTADASIAAVFEHTVLVSKKEPIVLTERV